MRLAISGALGGDNVCRAMKRVSVSSLTSGAGMQIGPTRDPPGMIPSVVGSHFAADRTLLRKNHCRPPIKKNTVFQVISQGPCQYPALDIPALAN